MNAIPNRDEDRGYERQRQAKLDAPIIRADQPRTGGSIDAAIAAVLKGEVAK